MSSESQINYKMFSLEIAINHVEKYVTENGFEIIKSQVQKNKKCKVVHCIFECKNSRKYHAKKKADTENNHNHESVKISCLWKVNFCLS
ncbi:8330_t:CDS:2, partial [Cetraspora pellucida]